MGHFCWMCGRSRPNEQFSGSGHMRHICRKCTKRPAAELHRAQALHDIYGFMGQRNISQKNIAYLETLCRSSDRDVDELAALVRELALVKPHKRRRVAVLRRQHPDLLARLISHNLLEAYEVDWGPTEIEGDPTFPPADAHDFC